MTKKRIVEIYDYAIGFIVAIDPVDINEVWLEPATDEEKMNTNCKEYFLRMEDENGLRYKVNPETAEALGLIQNYEEMKHFNFKLVVNMDKLTEMRMKDGFLTDTIFEVAGCISLQKAYEIFCKIHAQKTWRISDIEEML